MFLLWSSVRSYSKAFVVISLVTSLFPFCYFTTGAFPTMSQEMREEGISIGVVLLTMV